MSKSTLCIKVPKEQGQKTLSLAGKLELIDKSFEIQRDEETLYIPLLRQPKENELALMKIEVPDYKLANQKLVHKPTTVQRFPQALQNKLPPHLSASLPQALDLVGDISIVEVPVGLEAYENLIGETILKTHRNIRTVLAKASAVSGIYRLREFRFIAGEHKTQTVYKEFGCQYRIDIAKAYFSPRLSHEHQRVASVVKTGETVVDLFAGVGPFSVLIAKENPKTKVYAVDINPEAFELLRNNIRLNRVENQVSTVLGDARKIAATKLKGLADHVIMNLPETAIEFVDASCQAIKPQNGVIHFYAFVRSPDSIEQLKLRFSKSVEKNGRRVEAFLYAKSIREVAPYKSQVVLDAKIV
jgi:tRNA (guanine37-N1)-methyltransferase